MGRRDQQPREKKERKKKNKSLSGHIYSILTSEKKKGKQRLQGDFPTAIRR